MTSKTEKRSSSYRFSEATLADIEFVRVRQGKKSGKAVLEQLARDTATAYRFSDEMQAKHGIDTGMKRPFVASDKPVNEGLKGFTELTVEFDDEP